MSFDRRIRSDKVAKLALMNEPGVTAILRGAAYTRPLCTSTIWISPSISHSPSVKKIGSFELAGEKYAR